MSLSDMSDVPEYFVPSGYGEAELIEKRSRFIGRVWRVESEEEAAAKIRETREKYWDASHNVYAYILREGSLLRYSDDGEPQGTSGMPVLGVFRGAGIYNACCVVTRYFGGTLLGTGGLARAYSHTAGLALQAAGTSILRRWLKIRLVCPYHLYELILKELKQHDAAVSETDYGADVRLVALVPQGREQGFYKRLADISSGSVSAEALGEDFLAAPLGTMPERHETN